MATKKFIVWQQMFKGEWQAVHAMDANDDEEALRTAENWARYHGFSMSDVKVKEPVGDQVNWPSEDFFIRFRDG